MSFAATSWVMDVADIPNSQCFATLIVFANFANEHGRAYPATSTVAAKSRQNPKTVRTAIDTLEAAGLLIDTGRRVGPTGHVKVYALGMQGLPKVGALAGEIALDAPQAASEAAGDEAREGHPETVGLADGARAPVSGGKGTRKRVGEPARNPNPPEGAIAPSAPRGEKPGRSNVEWKVPAIADLPPAARAIAEQWPDGAYEAEAAGHRAWLAGQRRRVNSDLAWHARIVQLGAKPIQAARAGLRYSSAPAASSPPSTPAAAIARCGTADEGDQAAALRTALAGRFHENLVDRWIAPCRFDFNDDEVRVVAPTPFTLSWLRQNAATLIEFEAAAIIGRSAHVSWEVGVPA